MKRHLLFASAALFAFSDAAQAQVINLSCGEQNAQAAYISINLSEKYVTLDAHPEHLRFKNDSQNQIVEISPDIITFGNKVWPFDMYEINRKKGTFTILSGHKPPYSCVVLRNEPQF